MSGLKWFPYNKGGAYRKWYGNQTYLINWENDGRELNEMRPKSVIRSPDTYFKASLSWSKVTNGGFSMRFFPEGFIYDVAGCSVFFDNDRLRLKILGALNSRVMTDAYKRCFPTINLEVGQISEFPIVGELLTAESDEIVPIVEQLIKNSKQDWNSSEMSWGFSNNPLVSIGRDIKSGIADSFFHLILANEKLVEDSRILEEKNSKYFTNIYGLNGELDSSVSTNEVSLFSNFYFGSDKKNSEIIQVEQRTSYSQSLVSYAIGCMMGRYSLDEPGLIYAHAGNVGFEPGRYATFPADADGIVPITDELWFADDAPSRIREFLRAVWGPDTLEENMAWLAESLGTKASDTPDETIRRYIADKFFKDHLQTYKKRPIYWLFSSGKQGAFQALVYLHRYHEGTLARLRAEYVVPLTGKIQSRIEMLQKDAAAASSTAARNKLNKEIEKLTKKHAELLAYDEQLRHYADMRITLELDDGVKVNYGKFGDLLEGVKIVTGGSSDD